MTNLRTDEIIFFLHLTKIGTDENKAIYSITQVNIYISEREWDMATIPSEVTQAGLDDYNSVSIHLRERMRNGSHTFWGDPGRIGWL